MLPTLSIGPLVIPTAGLVTILGFWLVLTVVERSARRLGLEATAVYNLSALGLAAGLVCGRLVFVALHWGVYQNDLFGILWPLTSGYDTLAALAGGVMAAIFYGRAQQCPPVRTMDALAPSLVAMFMVNSLADFLAGPGYGELSLAPWAINLFGVPRHPVQLYELLVGALALMSWRWATKRQWQPGQLFLLAAAVYSAGRLFVDAYRANAWVTAGGWHVVQILSLLVLVGSLWLLGKTGGRDVKTTPS